MNNLKYWGKRLRLLGDTVSGGIAATSVAASGLASGDPVIDNLIWSASGLVVALVVWASLSFISGEMDSDDEDDD